MPLLGKKVVVNEQIHVGEEDAKAGVGVVPADNHSLFFGITRHHHIIDITPAFGGIGYTRPLHFGVFGNDVIGNVDNITAVGLFFGVRPHQHPRHFTGHARIGMYLHPPQTFFVH